MLASRDPVGDPGAARWRYRTAGESNVAAGRQPRATAGSRERPSGPAAIPAAACQRRHPAWRTVDRRFAPGIPAPPVVNQAWFGQTKFSRSPQRTSKPHADPRIPNYRLEDRDRLMPFRFAAPVNQCLRRINQHSGD